MACGAADYAPTLEAPRSKSPLSTRSLSVIQCPRHGIFFTQIAGWCLTRSTTARSIGPPHPTQLVLEGAVHDDESSSRVPGVCVSRDIHTCSWPPTLAGGRADHRGASC